MNDENVTRETGGGPADLWKVVRSYEPDGHAPSHRRAVELLQAQAAAWRRTLFDPGHFTASGYVSSPDGQSILIIHHQKLGRWLQPGGHFEAGDDTVEAASRREVLEETGVGHLIRVGTSLLRIDAHPIPERGSEPAHTHFDLGVAFQATSDSIGPIDEVLDARWVRFDDLADHGVDNAVLSGALELQDMVKGG